MTESLTETPTATRTTWTIDSAHTLVEFAVRHMMISTVKGRFSEVEGTVTTRDDDVTDATLEVKIGAASLDTRQPDRDTHLRSADFLDVENHPFLTYRSSRIEPRGEGKFRVVGQLSVRETTREVVLDVEEQGRGTDPWGGERAGFRATTQLDRRDFGVQWNQALEAGGLLVGNEVKITIEAELVQQTR